MRIIQSSLKLVLALVLTCGPVLALDNYCKRISTRVVTADTQIQTLCTSLVALENTAENRTVRQILTTQISILDRVKNLESYYSGLKSIVDWLSKIVESIGKFLGISTKPDTPSSTSTDPYTADYHHISGAVMSPGSVAFTVRTGDGMSFDAHNIDELDMDIYYNKNLFVIDKFIGSGIQGKDYEKLTLPTDTRSSRDRIKIPLSDVLTNKTTFYVYLAPLNGDTIKVGDQTKINLRYYKRVDAGEIAPLIYELKPGSIDTVKVISKSPV